MMCCINHQILQTGTAKLLTEVLEGITRYCGPFIGGLARGSDKLIIASCSSLSQMIWISSTSTNCRVSNLQQTNYYSVGLNIALWGKSLDKSTATCLTSSFSGHTNKILLIFRLVVSSVSSVTWPVTHLASQRSITS